MYMYVKGKGKKHQQRRLSKGICDLRQGRQVRKVTLQGEHAPRVDRYCPIFKGVKKRRKIRPDDWVDQPYPLPLLGMALMTVGNTP